MSDHLLLLHLKEEWRMMTSYFSSEKLFFLFPLVLFFLGFLMALLIPFIEKAFDIKELLVAFHLLLGLYGLFVGGFGFFADEVAQTWFGEARLTFTCIPYCPYHSGRFSPGSTLRTLCITLF